MKEKGANSSYFGNIREGLKTSLEGLRLSFKHILEARESRNPIGIENKDYFKQDTGIVTLQYPREVLPVPVNGRYKLHNEIEDCIVCDKCAKICPVNCIEIEAIKAPGEIAKASDGSSIRLYAARFDIDMAKCCFCGLCTTVCPTECLTMTPDYDFSTSEVGQMNFSFAMLSEHEAQQKREEFNAIQAAKQRAAEAARATSATIQPAAEEPAVSEPEKKKPFRPIMRKPAETSGTTTGDTEENQQAAAPQSGDDSAPTNATGADADKPAFRKPFKPIMRKPASTQNLPQEPGNLTAYDAGTNNSPEQPEEPRKPNRPVIPKRKPE